MKTTHPKLLKKAEKVFNAWIRERDKDEGCISRECNGDVIHAGHYFNVGQHSFMRYHEKNVHGCCIKCNVFLHGNLIKYRQGLIDRYGIEYVEELEKIESDAPKVFKWDRQKLDEIILRYGNK